MNTFGTDPHKLVRLEGPDTSHEAAQKVNSRKLEELVYEAIKSYGPSGCISEQILDRFKHYPYSSITARYSALMKRGQIKDSGRRLPCATGRSQRVMVADVHS